MRKATTCTSGTTMPDPHAWMQRAMTSTTKFCCTTPSSAPATKIPRATAKSGRVRYLVMKCAESGIVTPRNSM